VSLLSWRCRKRNWFLIVLVGIGLMLHLGTAILRLNSFFPFPRAVDFSAFYAGAGAVREGISPYEPSEAWLTAFVARQAMPSRPPRLYNPPFWPWILQPLTALAYPTAAWVWTLGNLLVLVWISRRLTRIAGYSSWKVTAAILPLVITFGPVFLDLSIGQTSVCLLALSLVVGRDVAHRESFRSDLRGGLAAGIAVGIKLFPLAWFGGLVLTRRLRLLLTGALATLLILSLGFLVMPEANRQYWFDSLPQRLTSAAGRGSIDDQALLAWLDRLLRPQTYRVPGLRVHERQEVVWQPPWSVSPATIRWIGYGLAAVLALPVAYLIIKTPSALLEGSFYLWILYLTTVFPHMERYNHALLLPALAWLWAAKQYPVVVWGYLLVGLSRLNHLWIILLPSPWGPLASGFGLYAVILLGIGMGQVLWRRQAQAEGGSGQCLATS
jgi:alpha-1,2-mannosyltransferase